MKFSEKKGHTKPPELQRDGMSDDLRASLWNVLHFFIWDREGFVEPRAFGYQPDIFRFARSLWFDYFKQPLDTIPDGPRATLFQIRTYFFGEPWYRVYDLLQFIVEQEDNQKLDTSLNQVLEREVAGYRFVNHVLTDLTNPEELEMLSGALADTAFPGVAQHLQRALELMSDRTKPDYRNSIKESISAVESMARALTGATKATLADALKALEKKRKVHSALKEGFAKLYGYTSDQGGIRHAMLDDGTNITVADARFFLLSCTSFINYLKAQA